MVVFRLTQGVFGAAIVPLSQTFLLDINPREKAGQAMAMWGAGIMVGPIIGPTLDGWLTESCNWRRVFLINLPVGVMALLGCLAFLPKMPRVRLSFDMTGFALLSLAIGSLQLMLDRGARSTGSHRRRSGFTFWCQSRGSGCSPCTSFERSTRSLTRRCSAT